MPLRSELFLWSLKYTDGRVLMVSEMYRLTHSVGISVCNKHHKQCWCQIVYQQFPWSLEYTDKYISLVYPYVIYTCQYFPSMWNSVWCQIVFVFPIYQFCKYLNSPLYTQHNNTSSNHNNKINISLSFNNKLIPLSLHWSESRP
jgi:hypothetical protein